MSLVYYAQLTLRMADAAVAMQHASCTGELHNDVLLLGMNGHAGVFNRIRVRNPHASAHALFDCEQLDDDRSFRARYHVHGVLAERFATYMEQYYGTVHTNCSSFAEYLRTGTFRDCAEDMISLAYDGTMRMYLGQRFRYGDIVCTVFFSDQARRRSTPPAVRSRYRKNRPYATNELFPFRGTRSRAVTMDAIRDMYDVFDEYHFAICIGYRGAIPIFLQQLGYHDTVTSAPICVSFGPVYATNKVPAMVLVAPGLRT